MSGTDGSERGSPWRSDSEAEFDHPERLPFSSPDPANRSGSVADPSTGSSGSAQVAETSLETEARTGTEAPTDTDASRGNRSGSTAGIGSRRGVLAAVAAVLAIIPAGAFVVGRETPSGQYADGVDATGPSSDPPSEADGGGDVAERRVVGSSLAACMAPRLPTSTERRWTVGLTDATGVVAPLRAGTASVAVLSVGADDDPIVDLTVFDALDGSQRWSSPISGASDPTVPAIVGGVVIVASVAEEAPDATVLRGFDERSGSLAWTQTVPPESTYAIDAVSESIVIEDPTGGADGVGFVVVHDASTGGPAAANVGRLVSLDSDRRLVTLAGGKFLAVPDFGTTENDVLLAVVNDPEAPSTAVGDSILIADGEPGELRLAGVDADGDRVERSIDVIGSATIDPPGDITSLSALGRSGVIVSGRGAVHGAMLDGDELEVRWRVEGLPWASAVTDRGRTVLVGSDGGATQRLVDASTGNRFLDVPSVGGALTGDDLFANGLLVRSGAGSSATRAAYDLDGELLWRLPGTGPLAIGDRVVYEVGVRTGTGTEPASISVSIAARGPLSDTPACDTGARDSSRNVES